MQKTKTDYTAHSRRIHTHTHSHLLGNRKNCMEWANQWYESDETKVGRETEEERRNEDEILNGPKYT